jgi:hypothetical protein
VGATSNGVLRGSLSANATRPYLPPEIFVVPDVDHGTTSPTYFTGSKTRKVRRLFLCGPSKLSLGYGV